MRDIKFRIWDKQNKRFVKNSCSLHACSQWMIDIETGWVYDAVQELHDHTTENGRVLTRGGSYETGSGIDPKYIIQQWTGLKDKNGVEIYEGDILKWRENLYSKVVFKYGGFWVEGINFIANDLLYEWSDSYKVIGNILENPELTKEPNAKTK